ncbi:MAG: methylmalonyl-CoA mutase family protein [Vicingaceae bacterium]
MHNDLFQEFSPLSDEDWMQQILKDLKGKIPEEKIFSGNQESIKVAPFYTANSVSHVLDESLPHNWITSLEVNLRHGAANNIDDDLKPGLESLFIRYNDSSDLIHYLKSQDLRLSNLILLKTGEGNLNLEAIPTSGITSTIITGRDVFSESALLGKYNDKIEESILNELADPQNGRDIIIDLSIYKNAGGNCIIELASMLSACNHLIEQFRSRSMNLNSIPERTSMILACGTEYNMEIAKMRAARVLLANLYSKQEIQNQASFLMAKCSEEIMSELDPHTNILRQTTSTMSAVLGGCDVFISKAFNGNDDPFANRISKNIQLLLKKEGHLDKVANPASGSYFIESLTTELSEKAWQLFKDMEDLGGFRECLNSGFIKREIDKSRSARMENYTSKKEILIGLNKYLDPAAKITGKTDSNVESTSPENAITPINFAQHFEYQDK